MKLFQINEDDLAEMERTLPQLHDTIMLPNDTQEASVLSRKQLRRMKEIISNVRWGYGPFSEVERIDTQPQDAAQ